ncbi:MAG: bifunctional demethylmenaquinone methyltransferase/2-methoxy-6-polyprenyl-1,4-benzoquinol methylase UbiE [Acidobacteriota bacterium]|nr:bifunctional demethylmenaquinone methyltransferase/2-methoxy-6-polyprenyl-1,4-benzoquinol methylase UbiE [Acidobacteriota bacterium]MDQ5838174.1 bifunctional demethylmenaquinone methyltransferase/2-methoxy-6-polyprenyl-1,4-benzoquinol methylase UbiE [Acidobacteriota bacterium]
MFGGIAGCYDLLNHLLSGNVDKGWRRLVARRLRPSLVEGARVLDVACGTGDLALALAASGAASVVGLDFCRPMLEIARRKAGGGQRRIPFVEGDALRLPFADESFDVVTIAFGLRNLAGVEEGLRELLRVLKAGGRVAVLEFSSPVVPGFSALFRFYMTRVLPRVGGLLSGSRGAYEYLPDSVLKFPDQKRLAALMREAGFAEVEYRNLTGGIAALHTGTRPRPKG